MDYQTILQELRNKASYLMMELEKVNIAIEAVEALAPGAGYYLTALPEPEPEPEAVTEVTPPKPNGWDRHAFRRQMADWRIRYPLGPTYAAGPSQMVKQAVCTTVQDHPRFKAWCRANGETRLRDGLRVPKHLMPICDFLGVDYEALEIEARLLHMDMIKYGTPGVDYLKEAR